MAVLHLEGKYAFPALNYPATLQNVYSTSESKQNLQDLFHQAYTQSSPSRAHLHFPAVQWLFQPVLIEL